jgi:16S rRNA (uracil1498-N3)-methyltransferase
MRRALCASLPRSPGGWVELPENESRHLLSVLRLSPGDPVEVLDGSGVFAPARLEFRGKTAGVVLTAPPVTDPLRLSAPVELFLSVLKGEAMEWVIEKSVELGVRALTPVESEFSVVKLKKKGSANFQERWQKIADQALKQSGRLDRMMIREPIPFAEALTPADSLLWLDEDLARNPLPEHHLGTPTENPGTEIPRLLIGPEGGFSPAEKALLLRLTGGEKRGIRRVHLGSLILRAETAALAAIAILVGQHYGKRKNPLQAPA